eukprot:gene8763-18128_t
MGNSSSTMNDVSFTIRIGMIAESIRRQYEDLSKRGVPQEKRQEELLDKYKEGMESLSPADLNRVCKEVMAKTKLDYKYQPSSLDNGQLIALEIGCSEIADNNSSCAKKLGDGDVKMSSHPISDGAHNDENVKHHGAHTDENVKHHNDYTQSQYNEGRYVNEIVLENDHNVGMKSKNTLVPLKQLEKAPVSSSLTNQDWFHKMTNGSPHKTPHLAPINGTEEPLANLVTKPHSSVSSVGPRAAGKAPPHRLVRASSQKFLPKLNIFKTKKMKTDVIAVISREPTPEEIVSNELMELKCSICNMTFDDIAKKNRHVQYSSLHANCMIKAKKGNSSNESKTVEVKVVEPGESLYFEHKMFWRTKDTVDIDVFIHHSHCGKKILEVIPYDVNYEIEFKRLYLEVSALVASIGDYRLREAAEESVKERRRSSLLLRFYSTAEEDRIKGESLIKMQVLSKLVVNRLLCLQSEGCGKEIVYSLGQGDSARVNPVLSLTDLPPNTLVPATIERCKKLRRSVVSLAMNNIAVLNRQASEQRFKAESMFNDVAALKLSLIMITEDQAQYMINYHVMLIPDYASISIDLQFHETFWVRELIKWYLQERHIPNEGVIISDKLQEDMNFIPWSYRHGVIVVILCLSEAAGKFHECEMLNVVVKSCGRQIQEWVLLLCLCVKLHVTASAVGSG